ncbi:hypothetical protein HYU92_01645 [Candidatus Curtissbacteria bacterium]|nr:hypothetical protein [Candidatus Curtissbacteria bacterium]
MERYPRRYFNKLVIGGLATLFSGCRKDDERPQVVEAQIVSSLLRESGQTFMFRSNEIVDDGKIYEVLGVPDIPEISSRRVTYKREKSEAVFILGASENHRFQVDKKNGQLYLLLMDSQTVMFWPEEIIKNYLNSSYVLKGSLDFLSERQIRVTFNNIIPDREYYLVWGNQLLGREGPDQLIREKTAHRFAVPRFN